MHTPGPWTYQRRRSDEYLIKGDTGSGYVATVYAAMVGDGPFEANARLIAAAPELLEACKNALRDIRDLMGQLEDAGANTADFDITVLELREAIENADGGKNENS